MAIQSADVLVTVVKEYRYADDNKQRLVRIVIPSGLTYDRGGVPLPFEKLGFRTTVDFVAVHGVGDGAGYATAFNQGTRRILFRVPSIRTGSSTVDQTWSATVDTIQMLDHAGNNSGLSIFHTQDAGGWGTYARVFHMMTMDEIASGDTIQACTLDCMVWGV